MIKFDSMKLYKSVLYIALLVVITLLGESWIKQSHLEKADAAQTPSVADQATDVDVSAVVHSTAAAPVKDVPAEPSRTVSASSKADLVSVSTDNLNIAIDLDGGNIVHADLKQYRYELNGDRNIALVSQEPGNALLPLSGVVDSKGNVKFRYAAGQKHYRVGSDKPLVVRLSGTQNGLELEKLYTFTAGDYAVGVEQRLTNHGKAAWEGSFSTAFLRQKGEDVPMDGKMKFGTYTGASYYQSGDPYTKLSYKDMNKKAVNQYIRGGWIAEQIRYFVAAWVPNADVTYQVKSKVYPGDLYSIMQISPAKRLLPGESMTMQAKLYLGPEIEENLSALSPGLKLTIDYGWLWWVSDGIFWCMKYIHSYVGNWGWSIILVTLLIKLLLYRFSESSYRSMAKMRDLQPRIEALKAQHGEDKQAMGQAMMEMYKREKVSPLGGCLPIFVQIPFFIALYYVLVESVQLHHAPFILWIHDLSSKDPYYVLPLIMGASMFLQQLLTPAVGDAQQAKMMRYGLPVIMTAVFINFPSGLVLYWITNNLLSLLQQWVVMRRVSGK